MYNRSANCPVCVDSTIEHLSKRRKLDSLRYGRRCAQLRQSGIYRSDANRTVCATVADALNFDKVAFIEATQTGQFALRSPMRSTSTKWHLSKRRKLDSLRYSYHKEKPDMYRSDVVGSLLRPPYLKEARERHETGELSDAAFKQIEDRAVAEAVELQDRAGVEVVSDGEMRRYAFYGHLVDSLEGFDKYGGWAIPFRNEKGEEVVQKRPVVVSKLRRKRHMCAEEYTRVRAQNRRQAKSTLRSAPQT